MVYAHGQLTRLHLGNWIFASLTATRSDEVGGPPEGATGITDDCILFDFCKIFYQICLRTSYYHMIRSGCIYIYIC